jgi:hypothetical protein
MTVSIKEPETKQNAPVSEQAAARAPEAEVPAAAEPSHKKQGAKQNGAKQKGIFSWKVIALLAVVGVLAVIIALVALVPHAAQVGVSLQCFDPR